MELQKKISFIHFTTLAALIMIPITAIMKFFLVSKRIGEDGFFAKGDIIPYVFSFVWFAIALAFLILSIKYRIKFTEYSDKSTTVSPASSDATNEILSTTSAPAYHSHPASRMIFSPARFPAVTFANVLCCLLMIASIIFPLAYQSEENPLNVLDKISLGVRAVTAVYFLFMAFKRSNYNNLKMQLSALIMPIWAILEIINLFFDLNDIANIFPSIFKFLAISFIGLFFITEAKFTLSNPGYYSLARYVSFAEIAIIFGSASFISDAILSLTSGSQSTITSAFTDLAFLGVLTYVIIKLIKVNLFFKSHKRIFSVIK